MSGIVYLDNSSTTKPFPEVVTVVAEALESGYGNPSSLHRLGEDVSKKLESARKNVASLLGAAPDEVFFTSGGTEANNWALFGTYRFFGGKRPHIVTTAVEHPSVMETVSVLKREGALVTVVGVDRSGFVSPEEIKAHIRDDTALVSVMYVQNEIGTIEPVKEIGAIIAELGPRRPRFHVDAVQGFARLPIDVKEWNVDLLSVSAHKIHGPKGVGALYIRKGVEIRPLVYGGGQEGGMRSGTENVPGILGFGKACEIWLSDRTATVAESVDSLMERFRKLRRKLVDGVREIFPDAVLHGPEDGNVAPYIVHFAFPGFRGETILHALEARGVFVSTGSACSSHHPKPSPVILALGRSEDEALSSIRFSMSRFTTEREIDRAIEALADALRELLPWRQSSERGRR
ncbi:MAG TPA: cysteine desulfurase [Firmicutes bacterium]|nr:cysteine desulfurase [Candidatus Fermentithermobacillaceae bacterium]